MTDCEKIVDLDAWRNRAISKRVEDFFNQMHPATLERLIRDAKKITDAVEQEQPR